MLTNLTTISGTVTDEACAISCLTNPSCTNAIQMGASGCTLESNSDLIAQLNATSMDGYVQLMRCKIRINFLMENEKILLL